MISPVNSDKPINTSTDQSGRSHTSQKTTETSTQAASQQTQAPQASSSTVEVDQARRLYDLENNRVQATQSSLATAEEARSLLENIVQQMAATPQTAASAQAGKAAADPMAGILQSAPT
ncbi:MAG: hypothetical protein ABW092_01825 [Candidatus Thiodiazotropha sp.]